MSKRGNRGKKATSNFKVNMQTLGLKTVDIVLGVPHFAISLIGHEVAQIESLARYAIAGKDIDKSIDRRKMMSEDYRERAEEAVDSSIDFIADKSKSAFEKVKSAFNKKPEAEQA